MMHAVQGFIGFKVLVETNQTSVGQFFGVSK